MGGFWVERRVRRVSYWVRKALPTPPRPITATKMGVGVVMVVRQWVVGEVWEVDEKMDLF